MIVPRTDVVRLAEATDAAMVGGKAINLQKLIAAGFPVPDGFVITTHAYREALAAGRMPGHIADAIRTAYRQLGAPVVAVRSSATAEDLAGSSMAGQYETILDVQGEDAVLDAVQRCWASVAAERVGVYLKERGIDRAQVAMAVVVQLLVRADVAGVLFTANPRTGARHELVIDASWGLGEAVVSGLVQPDTLTVDRATGAVLTCTVGDKRLAIHAGDHETREVPAARRAMCCLTALQVRELWKLGLLVLEHFGGAQDMEWAIEGDRLFLLQTRAITTLEDAEAYHELLTAVRAELRAASEAGRGPWVVHNLGETVPHPHPLTWSVLGRFMGGAGGFGRLYKRLGYVPSPRVERDGFLDLVGGRIYLDCARGPELFLDGYPFAYDIDLLRSDPDASQRPPTLPVGGLGATFSAGRRLAGIPTTVAALAGHADRDFRERDVPAFAAWIATERARDLGALDAAGWWACWQEREQRILDDFAPASLLPSVLAVWALDELRSFLGEHVWDAEPAELTNRLSVGGAEDCTARANQGLYELAHGSRTRAAWLDEHGHRALGEFDLAAPRWDECPERVDQLAAHLAKGAAPHEAHQRRVSEARDLAERLGATLSSTARAEFRRRLALVHRYTPFREDAKGELMRGYRLLRDLARQAGRRLDIGDDVFLLTRDEVRDALAIGFAPLHLLDRRRLERAAQTRLTLPTVIGPDDIAHVGELRVEAGADRWSALAISPGIATGPARIVRSPLDAGDLGQGYLLVCTSTDPSWTPLFVNAAGVVLERGGTLSHGAVVAREMGVPAVVLPDACTRLIEGESIIVDGNRGAVARAAAAPVADERPELTDTRIPWTALPPQRGAGEARSASWRDRSLLVWTIALAAFFLLPEPWVRLPVFAAMDAVLLPLVPRFGPAGTVAIIAVALAVLTLGLQRLLTDNARLTEAKRRAAALRAEAETLPAGSPRRAALLAAAAPVNGRVTMAAMVPLAVTLGPLVVSFLWLPERLDRPAWNPLRGSVAAVQVVVAGDHLDPVVLAIDPACTLTDITPVEQSLPPIRATLETLRADWRRSVDLSDQPWPVRAAALRSAESLRADLDAYLATPIPDQTLAWTVELPEQDGAFPLSVRSGTQRIETRLVAGHGVPPPSKLDLEDGRGPIQALLADGSLRTLSVTYKQPTDQPAFWQPFARFGWLWDAGWLWTYLIAYLPAMLLSKKLLKVA